ncbi:MAG TPA: [FeFe] hydrogenase H-cluster radical SAM maturase HydE [Candidatus Omnitrophota bacterium]|nr:[FeFe] hydrogenase H-cluster radical SAM maturase HydE [Candidatus Omnitrophota bacterium]
MTQKDIVRYLLEHDRSVVTSLFARADRVRSRFVGSGVHLRGLIEFSNYCCQDCLYCGLRRSNRRVKRYRMLYAQIFDVCRQAKALGIKTIVLQSGEDRRYRVRDLCGLVTDIKKLGLAVTLSIGELSYAQYRQLRLAGADRYLLRFETSDPKLYASLRPGRTLAQRLRCLSWLHKLGYETGSGMMTGLPGQTAGSIADDICLFGKLDLDMIGIGPFIPHPHTPLAKARPGSLELVLKAIALTRIMTSDTNIPATTAAGTIDPRGREKALRCGANVLMPNMTPPPYRRLYEIYPDKVCINEGEFSRGAYLARMIRRIGRTISSDYGYRKGDR